MTFRPGPTHGPLSATPHPSTLIRGPSIGSDLGPFEPVPLGNPRRPPGRDDVHLRHDHPRRPRVRDPDPRPRPPRPPVHAKRATGRPDVRAPPVGLEPDAVPLLAPDGGPLGPLRPPPRPDPLRDRPRLRLHHHGPRAEPHLAVH